MIDDDEREPPRVYQGYKVATLERLPSISTEDVISCDCGEQHVVHGGRKLFVVCRGAIRVAGIAGRCVLGVKPDADSAP